ncbi:hypothetical protein PVAP13_7KG134000 [Panicum virgatum]|uniref:Uncharacterized protein n=1 Tax=Panicum virgatum TaxID=38727 RepID=A0A8T0QCC4_PANVG|nr:hypothetical protein PVAP13_7KG134000 [Panicum virgatum]
MAPFLRRCHSGSRLLPAVPNFNLLRSCTIYDSYSPLFSLEFFSFSLVNLRLQGQLLTGSVIYMYQVLFQNLLIKSFYLMNMSYQDC